MDYTNFISFAGRHLLERRHHRFLSAIPATSRAHGARQKSNAFLFNLLLLKTNQEVREQGVEKHVVELLTSRGNDM